jgi:hypothetical protein
LLALLSDPHPRLAAAPEWPTDIHVIRQRVQTELEQSFDESLQSWMRGESQRGWVWVDNALYVMYCLKDAVGLSKELRRQRKESIRRLLARSSPSGEHGAARGIALFSDQPEVGATAQLAEIIFNLGDAGESPELEDFVAASIAARRVMPETFSWHLSAALAIPGLRDRTI